MILSKYPTSGTGIQNANPSRSKQKSLSTTCNMLWMKLKLRCLVTTGEMDQGNLWQTSE